MTTAQAAHIQAAVDLIQDYGSGVSIVEIQRHLEGLALDCTGTISLESKANVVFWGGMSQEFADVLDALMSHPSVEMRTTTPLVYVIDGAVPRLPIAKRVPKSGYRDPHWLPITFRAKGEPVD